MSSNPDLPSDILASIDKIQATITTDPGKRGMKNLVVPGDLLESGKIFARLQSKDPKSPPHVVILSGFPCCVDHDPPTETDGPPGAYSIALAAVGLGYRVTVVTDACNEKVFEAAREALLDGSLKNVEQADGLVQLVAFPGEHNMSDQDHDDLKVLAKSADLLIACERAGPAADGNCYTMRAINMNEKSLIAPLHLMVDVVRDNNVKFLAIGDGGNEMGMGKVIDAVYQHIPNGAKVGAVTAADHLIAASVSNWGGYALAGVAALVRATDENATTGAGLLGWTEKCVPTEEAELELLQRCVDAGCRDGVSGQKEATVDGMSASENMDYLREIRDACLGKRREE
ncbi:predicted protein [Thalassiosira pseudonana CCMP1335]|uniref:D-glutamate cyclase-like C-terminal domain-containing protein n=1 Tax=Thalassiosira pseudonana TaxID=35128 RepID=B8C1X2_THAPS|nr:predicted protein [Thalassiosira pseudonana CCMP1335]EED92292.1 predicted protein [Thalassiosira pseudonana CCMP1335]